MNLWDDTTLADGMAAQQRSVIFTYGWLVGTTVTGRETALFS